jgi:hypothetical protein
MTEAPAQPTKEQKVSDVPEGNPIETRLRRAASLPQTLEAGFDAFEAIRIAARSYQDQMPALLPAFMSAADAAVDGREALTAAPSLPFDGGTPVVPAVPVIAGTPEDAADDLAALAAMLSERLADAARIAEASSDRAACQNASAAAERISQLLARADS